MEHVVRISDNGTAALDALDVRILDLLRQNARITNVEVARRFSVSERTVRNRIERLIRDIGLGFTIRTTEPQAPTRAIYLIRASPGTRFELAAQLRSRREVASVYLTNGGCDIVTVASFADASDALKFAVEQIEGDPRVASYDDLAIIREVAESREPEANSVSPAIAEEILLRALMGIPNFVDVQQALSWLCQLFHRVFGADHVLASTDAAVEPGGPQNLANFATYGLPDNYARLAEDYPQSHSDRSLSPVVRMLETRQHVFIENVFDQTTMREVQILAQKVGYTSLIVFPLLHGGERPGAVVLYYDQQIRIDDAFVSSVQRALDYIGIAIRPLTSLVT